MTRALIVLLALPLLTAASPDVALAASPTEEARAKDHYERGSAHFARGEYDLAIAELVLALGYDRRPAYLWNIARAYEKKGDFKNARVYFDQYRSVAPGPAEEREAEAKILALERLEAERSAVGTVSIRANVDGARVRVDGREHGVTPLDGFIELSIGEHVIELTKDGYDPVRTAIRVEGGLTQAVHLELREAAHHVTGELLLTVRDDGARARVNGEEVGVGPFERVLRLGVGRHEVVVDKTGLTPFVRSVAITQGERVALAPRLGVFDDDRSADGTLSTVGWVTLGVGAATAGVGAYLLANPSVSEQVEGGNRQTTTDYTAGLAVTSAGAAVLITGLVLLVVDGGEPDPASPPDLAVQVGLGPSGPRLGLAGRF